MSETATITATVVPSTEATTGAKSKKGAAAALRGRLAPVPVYDGARVIKGKNGKDIHWAGKTIQKRSSKHYKRNPTGVTLKLARVTKNYRGALDKNREALKPLLQLTNVAMTRGAAEANLIVMDELFNSQLALQSEMCHNYRTGHTSQLTCDIVNRSYNARGIYKKK